MSNLIYTKFNRKNIQDRQIDSLIGISKGLLADGTVNQAEAEFLMGWLIQNRAASDNPIVGNLLLKVSDMLEDGVLDNVEAAELFSILRGLSGEESEIGELAKPTTLPLNNPPPTKIEFKNKNFLFTGTCAFGTRVECKRAIEILGGKVLSAVNKNLDYVVIGAYVSDSWVHETFGRKIEKAVKYRDSGVPVMIISEQHWIDSFESDILEKIA